MLYFLLLNILVLFSSLKIARQFFKLHNIYDLILGVFLLFWAQVVLTSQVLGLLNILDVNWLLLLNSLIALFVLLAGRKRKKHVLETDPKISHLFINNKVVIFCTAAIIGFGLAKIFINLMNAPVGWDSLNYHFTFPVEWLKAKSFLMPPTICDDPTPTYYPINGGIFYFWLIAPFRDVFLADLGQVPFLLASFVAILALCRKFHISKELSFYAAALFVIMPNVFKNIEIAYADIFVVALFLISLNFLYNLYKKCNLKNVILVAISLGLLLGAKTAGLPYMGLIFLFSLYIILRNAKKLGFLKFSGYIFGLVVLIACFGGFGYMRNFFITGNPLYPFPLKILGRTIFSGPMPRSTYQAHWSGADYNLAKLLFHEGFGPQLFLFILPGIFLMPILAVKRGLKSYSLFERFIFILPVIMYLIFRYGVPQLWTRFLYPFMAVGLMVSMYAVSQFRIPSKVIRVFVVVFFLASIAELSGHAELIWSLIMTATGFFLIPKAVKYIIENKKRLMRISWVAIVAAIVCFKLLQINYTNNEFRRYAGEDTPYNKELAKGWIWLNENTKKEGENIAYTARPLPFPLYGTKLKNNVYYVSINEVEPAWLHRFADAELIWDEKYSSIHKKLSEDNNYRGRPNISVWRKNLKNRNIDYVVVYPLHQTDVFPIEDIWAKSDPNNFKLVFSNDQIHIYKSGL